MDTDGADGRSSRHGRTLQGTKLRNSEEEIADEEYRGVDGTSAEAVAAAVRRRWNAGASRRKERRR